VTIGNLGLSMLGHHVQGEDRHQEREHRCNHSAVLDASADKAIEREGLRSETEDWHLPDQLIELRAASCNDGIGLTGQIAVAHGDDPRKCESVRLDGSVQFLNTAVMQALSLALDRTKINRLDPALTA
jgi:hypothetical protein